MNKMPKICTVLLLGSSLFALNNHLISASENNEDITDTNVEHVENLPPVEESETDQTDKKSIIFEETKEGELAESELGSEADTSDLDKNQELLGDKTTVTQLQSDDTEKVSERISVPNEVVLNDIYMTETHTDILELPEENLELSDFKITYNNKELTEWKQWNIETGAFDGAPVVSVEQIDDHQLQVVINPMFGMRDLSQRWPNNLRRVYQKYIGEYTLAFTDIHTNKTFEKKYNLRPYKNFHTYDEMITETNQIKDNSQDDRYVTIEEYGYSVEGRPLRLAIVASDRQSIDDYLSITTPVMLQNPNELLLQLAKGTLDYKVPIFINNTHPDEQPAIDVVIGLFKQFATKDNVTFKTMIDGKEVVQTINVSDALKKAFFLFSFVENPDGFFHNTRSNATGLDINRDHGYQTQPETQAMVTQISKYNPISFLDFHGFVEDFLIEPCTPPHDPNFEYDLLKNNMLEHAHAMGNAGIANSAYESYIIPMEDWKSGWDDDFSGYTAVYSVYHGVMGHTIEIPEMNQDSYNAGLYAGLGGISYILNNRDRLFKNKLLIFQRGLMKVDAKEANDELIGPNNQIVGRPDLGDGQFFPDYYVIPMDLKTQQDTNQAFQMIRYFKRNGVVLQELKEDVTKNGMNYHKGDLVIDMAQAKRGVANMALWQGNNDSNWEAMYAEIVVNFPVMRGFDVYRVMGDKLFENQLREVSWKRAPRAEVPVAAPYYLVENNGLSAIQAVNKAISSGFKVYLAKEGYYFSQGALAATYGDFSLKATPYYKDMTSSALTAKKVFAPGNPNASLGYQSVSEATLALQQMGFIIVDSIDDADVVILDGDDFDLEWIGKKPMIIVGGVAIKEALKSGKLTGIELGSTDLSHEGLLKALVNKDLFVSNGYKAESYFYTTSGSWLKLNNSIFKPVVQIGDDNPFISGWWPNHEKAFNQIVAVDGTIDNMPTFIYAGNPLNKLHTQSFYRWISNAILRGNQLVPLMKDKKQEVLIQEQLDRAISQNIAQPMSVATLPQTGESETIFIIGTLFIAIGGVISTISLNKKREEL